MSKLATGAAIISEWLGEGGVPVPREQAQARANVCLNCEFNAKRTLWEQLEQPVIVTIRALLKLKSGMKMRVAGEQQLGTCKICACQINLKVHAPIKFIADETDDETLAEFPPWCTFKQEIVEYRKTNL